MDPLVKFSCGYKPADVKQGSALSCGGIMFIIVFLATFLIINVIQKDVGMILMMLAFMVLFFGTIIKSSMDQYLHVTPLALQIVRSDGRVMKEYPLKDIREIYASDRDTVKIMVWSETLRAPVEETLRSVADTDGLVAAVTKYGYVRSTAPNLIQEVPRQIPARPVQPHIMREDEADEIHAAQHLLNQGMISPKQYSGLLVPPVPDRLPDRLPECMPELSTDVNAQNAADYLQRQAMIAQQLGADPQTDETEKEKDEYGRAGLV